MIGSTTNTAVERQARMIQESYRLAVGGLVALQEQDASIADKPPPTTEDRSRVRGRPHSGPKGTGRL